MCNSDTNKPDATLAAVRRREADHDGYARKRVAVERRPVPPPEADPRLQGRALVTPIGWVVAGEMDEHRWLEYGRQIGRLANATAWWIGDWLRFGNSRFGEKYLLATRLTGYDVVYGRAAARRVAHLP